MATRTSGRTGEQRSSPIQRVQTLVRDTYVEIQKVSWPDAQTTRNLTLLVIAMAVILGVLLGGIDALFVRLWQLAA